MQRRTRACLLVVALPIVLCLALQLVPVWLLQANPPVKAEPRWDSAQTRDLARRACFDCHSNETVWPWYSKVAPVSWLVTYDTIRGRRHLNFSEWGIASGASGGREGEREREEEGEDMGEVILEGEMPPSNYLIMHPEAQLSAADKRRLAQALDALPK